MFKRLLCKLLGHKRLVCKQINSILYLHTCPRCDKKWEQEFKTCYLPLCSITKETHIPIIMENWIERK